jgi:dihydropteroate synthase
MMIGGRELALGRKTLLMGILNTTPDSFSDGGHYSELDGAVAHGLDLLEAGADIVDVGGESTRPGGAGRVDAREERRRVVPVISALKQRSQCLVSVDTTRTEVARAAWEAGADLVNDISGLRFDPAMAGWLAETRVPIVIMHSRGDFATLHENPRYGDVMGEVVAELGDATARARAAGVSAEQIVIDPGLGFAKDASHSLETLRRLGELAVLDRPILVGPSRKSFIGKVLDLPVGERLLGTAAAVAAAILGGAHIVRVHDVRAMRQVAGVCDAILGEA